MRAKVLAGGAGVSDFSVAVDDEAVGLDVLLQRFGDRLREAGSQEHGGRRAALGQGHVTLENGEFGVKNFVRKKENIYWFSLV